MANKKTGFDKDLYLSESKLTTRGVANISLLEEALVNQTDSGRLDTIPSTIHQDQDDNQIEGDSNVDNDVDCVASINRNNIDLH